MLKCERLNRTPLNHTRPLTALVLITAAALTVSACVSTPVDSTAPPAEDIRVELLEWARLAQNAHNYQSWRVVQDQSRTDRMQLFIETERLLPETDPPARQVTISAGNFLAVLHARAAQLGYDARITLFPEGEYDITTIADRPVADIVLVRAAQTESDWAIAAEPDAITGATVKYRYQPAEFDQALRDRITRWDGAEPGVSVAVITDPREVAWLNDLSREAFHIEMTTAGPRGESYQSTRMTRRARRNTPYGLAYTANFPRGVLPFVEMSQALFPQREEPWARTGINLFTGSLEHINSYIVITTADNTRATQVHTGMVLQSIWMELHAADHVALANSQALQEYQEMSALYAAAHQRLARPGETVQMMLAVARPSRGRHHFSPRLSVEDLIAVP